MNLQTTLLKNKLHSYSTVTHVYFNVVYADEIKFSPMFLKLWA